MAIYDSCPHCGREAEESIFSSHFPIYTCQECGEKYCSDDGPPCPECGDDDYDEKDEVYK